MNDDHKAEDFNADDNDAVATALSRPIFPMTDNEEMNKELEELIQAMEGAEINKQTRHYTSASANSDYYGVKSQPIRVYRSRYSDEKLLQRIRQTNDHDVRDST